MKDSICMLMALSSSRERPIMWEGGYLKEQSPREAERMAQVGELFHVPAMEDKNARQVHVWTGFRPSVGKSDDFCFLKKV